MAGVDVGAAGGHKRATNSEINMIPFIDLLMCTIAFLLITAVWVTNSRIPADAQVPGPAAEVTVSHPPERVLHLDVTDRDFVLAWKQGSTLVSEVHVPRTKVEVGGGESVVRYPALAQAIAKDWEQFHEHFDASDKKQDQLVLHSDDHTPFKDLIAVLDAANGTRREMRTPRGAVALVPAFNPTFAMR